MKKLQCSNCLKPMGEIEKGRLKKDLRYICQPCLTSLFTLKQKQNQPKSKYEEVFGGMFG